MNFIQGESGLRVIKPTNTTTVEPENILKWRSTLPMSDIGATARKIYEAISDIIDKDSVPEKKFKALEILRPIIQHVCLGLKKHFFNNTKPLDDVQLQVIELSNALQLEMLNGYKQVIEKLHKKGGLTLAAAIHRALHFYDMILIRYTSLYWAYPDDVWKEIHILYKIAEKNKLLTMEIKNEEISAILPLTIEKMYFSNLLLSVTDPYIWRCTELQILQTIFPTWVDLVSLESGNKNDVNEIGKFLVQQDEDFPPKICSKFDSEKISENKVFNITKLLEHIKMLAPELSSNNMENLIKNNSKLEYRLSEHMVKNLIHAWSNTQIRKEERKEANEEVSIIIGLQDCHYYLNNKQELDLDSATEAEEDDDNDINSMPMGLPSFEIDDGDIGIDADSSEEEDDEKEIQSKKHPTYDGMLVNKSSNGLRIIWKGPSYPALQSGTLIGIKNKNKANTSAWSIGSIKWIKLRGEDLEIGVHVYSPYAVAAGIQPIREGQNSGYYLKCLILPSVSSMGIDDSTIITPTIPFKENSNSSLIYSNNGRSISIVLTNLAYQTGTYKQFQFNIDKKETAKRMEKRKKAEEKKKLSLSGSSKIELFNPGAKSDSFNSLWDKL